jgi:alkylhydroperoxidase/carboxymuconolactone decarboxylase family protein YurZ
MQLPPQPPETYQDFIKRYPRLAQAWDLIGSAGKEGPLDERVIRLIKLAAAIGAMREGAVHANVRKALGAGIRKEEIEQVIALCAGTLGLPATVAVFSWVQDALTPTEQRT